jgi:hypothetical protein
MKKLLIIPMLFMCSMVIGQSKKIIGKPIKIENFEVAQNDFPKEMTWYEAKKACYALGSRWRLPTKNELNLLYINKDEIGGFVASYYWSSIENYGNNAWGQSFRDGGQDSGSRYYKCLVRAVRAF